MKLFTRRCTLLAAALLVVWACCLSAPAAQAEPIVEIIINGQQIVSEVQPVIVEGRTYVPLRVVSENLGARVTWMEEERQVVINWKTETTPDLPRTSGDIPIILDGQVLKIPATYGKPFINSQWRTMIPLRAVGEALDCDVQWLAQSYTVVIDSKAQLEDQLEEQLEEQLEDRRLLSDLAAFKTNLKLMDGSVINSASLAGKDPSSYSSEQMEVFKKYRSDLDKYGADVTLPGGETINAADLTIMGKPYLNAKQLNNWLHQNRARAGSTSSGLADLPPDLAELYLKIGAEYGVRGDLAFCQAAKETRYFLYGNEVEPWQNNYCGLYATGAPRNGDEDLNGADPSQVWFMPGVHGAIFATPKAGVEAHIQHLYGYATKKDLPAGKVLVDPRYNLITKGSASNWVGLGTRWAPSFTYGRSIIDYWGKAY